MQPLIDTQQFLALSSLLNYQLSGEPINWRGIINLMVGPKAGTLSEELTIEALAYLSEAYGSQKRRLGPLAILHPIRAASLMVRARESVTSLDLLTALLHDKQEDLTMEKYSQIAWRDLESLYRSLVERTSHGARGEDLEQRLEPLTRRNDEPYHQYLVRLIRQAGEVPEILQVKLADRLDNTLDLRIDLQDFTDQLDCYEVIFEALFVHSYQGIPPREPHPVGRKINGAMRLYQLYKNAVFLSLLRSESAPLDPPAQKLFIALATASIREAHRSMLHIFAYHLQDPAEQQDLLRGVMTYSQAGGLRRINIGDRHTLDGLFKQRFDRESKAERRRSLEELYRNKRLMGETAVAFIAIFTNFMNDPEFRIRGISAAGLRPPVEEELLPQL